MGLPSHHMKVISGCTTRTISKVQRHAVALPSIVGNGFEEEQDEEFFVSGKTLIWRAVKLPIYAVALVPLTVASAVAYLQTVLAMTSLKKQNDSSAFSGRTILYLNRHQTEERKGWMQVNNRRMEIKAISYSHDETEI
ncbi:hypothetical protein Ahy_B02g060195 [Arachis hypogaea]|uniref:Uncharacterized protein n=1 Tax=Arachis hypogaea TaxID=3818 RepID=A0A445AI27_ARAHY|nr:hypothetical protein Ahy_B02g060195 [Arachis hypogaea]